MSTGRATRASGVTRDQSPSRGCRNDPDALGRFERETQTLGAPRDVTSPFSRQPGRPLQFKMSKVVATRWRSVRRQKVANSGATRAFFDSSAR